MLYIIQKMKNVDKVYQISFISSFNTLPTSQIIEYLGTIMDDNSYLFSLITSIFDLPIINDRDGKVIKNMKYKMLAPQS